uniref:Uncharacterized protein n=1 Tax=Romanomermis culicivorax TaxID=13658 RepID=A0A915HSQ8_ROMCU
MKRRAVVGPLHNDCHKSRLSLVIIEAQTVDCNLIKCHRDGTDLNFSCNRTRTSNFGLLGHGRP